jgi:hypothetical protein
VVSDTAQRLWERLPRVYRTMDAAQPDWPFKRLIAALATFPDELDAMAELLRGNRPVGPATPVPWDLEPDELARWQEARTDRNSAITDPDLALPEWLPWLAQMLGVALHPLSGLTERRDTIRFATSGYRGGTRAALADAARPVLTGSRYVDVQPGITASGATGTMWDVAIRTRTSETPGGGQSVLDAITRQGAKPAGVQLHYRSFGTSWDIIESRYPTWTDWEARTWDQLEEAGATYAVPENMAPGPSFETNPDIAQWTATAEGGSAPTWPAAPIAGAGVDGANAGRLTKVGATGGMALTSAQITDARILPGREYVFSISAKPSVAMPLTMMVNWFNSAGTALSSTLVPVGTLVAGDWNRALATTRHTAPANAARARLVPRFTGTIAAGATVDLDAALFRLVTTTGG